MQCGRPAFLQLRPRCPCLPQGECGAGCRARCRQGQRCSSAAQGTGAGGLACNEASRSTGCWQAWACCCPCHAGWCSGRRVPSLLDWGHSSFVNAHHLFGIARTHIPHLPLQNSEPRLPALLLQALEAARKEVTELREARLSSEAAHNKDRLAHAGILVGACRAHGRASRVGGSVAWAWGWCMSRACWHAGWRV